MSKRRTFATMLFALTAFAAGVFFAPAGLQAAPTLPPAAAKIIADPLYKHSLWGLLVVDQASGQVVNQLNPELFFAPASNTKLFTCAAALEIFGANWRYETPVFMQGALEPGGVLSGNLILRASGDLTLGGRTTPKGEIAYTDSDHTNANSLGGSITRPDPLAGLNDLARQVAAAGIKEVRGQVIIDGRLFETSRAPAGGDTVLSPMVINDNLLDLTLTPAQPGQPARLDWRPRTAAFRVISQVKTVAAGEETGLEVVSPKPGMVLIRGQIAATGGPQLRIFQAPHPVSFARTLFIEALGRAGVRVSAKPLGANPAGLLPPWSGYAKLKKVAQFTSPPFSQTIKLILKTSHNLGANLLPLLMASQKGQRGFEQGMLIEGQTLKKMGVDLSVVSLGDGEGGVMADHFSPAAAVGLLSLMSQHRDFKAYHDALPILGVDGTLAHTVGPKSPARGKVRAKTGTSLRGDEASNRVFLAARGLAGYMTAQSGRKLIFAMYINNLLIKDMPALMRVISDSGKVCEAIYLAN